MLVKKAFKRNFYDKTCNVKRATTVEVGTQLVQKDVDVYTNINCSFWKLKQTNLRESELAVNTDTATHEVNLKFENTDILLGDTIELTDFGVSKGTFKVVDILFNKDSRGSLDNVQLLVNATTNASQT